jgi:branched-chain amino acid transport system substrate-binding protein
MRPRLLAVLVASALAVTTAACATAAGSDECPPLAVAFVGALTGPSAMNGVVKRNSVAIAVGDHNLGRPDCEVGLISFDSQGEADQAVLHAQRIVDDPQIVAVLGPVFSGETEAVMPIFEAAGLAILTSSATSARLGQQGWQTFHRLVSNDADQGPAIAAWLAEGRGAVRVAVIDDGSLYGDGLAEIVAQDLVDRGLEVPLRDRVDAGRLDYSDMIALIESSGVDAVFFGGLSTAGTQLYQQMRAAGLGMVFAGADGIFLKAFLEVAAGDADVLVTCPCVGSAITPEQFEFSATYRATFGQPVSNFAFEAFDAANLVLGLIDQGATTRAQMLTGLDTVRFDGITKQVGFDEFGEVTTTEIYLFDVLGGVFTPRAVVRDGELVVLE